mmetsp:Transcript_2104/g.4407  ORF Transcript_2104/g.4407 Transcript_2104/m.4407 type:complete len:398 (-) Transcript_2104:46-1239(-)
MVEKLLVQEIPGRARGSSSRGGGTGHFDPRDPLGGNLVPPCSVAPGDRVLVFHGALDFPVSGGIDKVHDVFVVVVFLDRVRSSSGFSRGKTVNRQIARHVVLYVQNADFFPSVGALPLSVPSLRALLGLLLVEQIHASHSHGGSGNRTNQCSVLSGGGSPLDFLHGGLDFFVLDGIDQIKGFSRLGRLGLDVVVQVFEVIGSVLVVSNLDKGNGNRASLKVFCREALDRFQKCGIEVLDIARLAGSQHQHGDGSFGEILVKGIVDAFLHCGTHVTASTRTLVVDHFFNVLGILNVAVPLGISLATKADNVDTIGIDLDDLRDDLVEADYGLFPARGWAAGVSLRFLLFRRARRAGRPHLLVEGLSDLLFELREHVLHETHIDCSLFWYYWLVVVVVV